MVVTQQMQQSVNQQRSNPMRNALVKFARLPPCRIDRNNDVAECERRRVCRYEVSGRWDFAMLFQLWKRKHVGRPIFCTVIAIESPDSAIAHEHQ